MKIVRQSHTLRFSEPGWKLITARAKLRLPLYRGKIQRARYLEELTLNESASAEETKKK